MRKLRHGEAQGLVHTHQWQRGDSNPSTAALGVVAWEPSMLCAELGAQALPCCIAGSSRQPYTVTVHEGAYRQRAARTQSKYRCVSRARAWITASRWLWQCDSNTGDRCGVSLTGCLGKCSPPVAGVGGGSLLRVVPSFTILRLLPLPRCPASSLSTTLRVRALSSWKL